MTQKLKARKSTKKRLKTWYTLRAVHPITSCKERKKRQNYFRDHIHYTLLQLYFNIIIIQILFFKKCSLYCIISLTVDSVVFEETSLSLSIRQKKVDSDTHSWEKINRLDKAVFNVQLWLVWGGGPSVKLVSGLLCQDSCLRNVVEWLSNRYSHSLSYLHVTSSRLSVFCMLLHLLFLCRRRCLEMPWLPKEWPKCQSHLPFYQKSWSPHVGCFTRISVLTVTRLLSPEEKDTDREINLFL